MASLFKYRNKYYIAYHINGRRITKSTQLDFVPANKTKAESAKKEIEKLEQENKMKIKYGAITPKSNDEKLTLEDAVSLYSNTFKKTTASGNRNNHFRTFEVAMRQFQKDVQPDTDVTKITKSEISTFIRRKENEVKNATVHTYIRYLKGFFNYLIEEEYLDKSPIVKRLVPKSVIKSIKIFKENDIELILGQAKLKSPEYFIIYKFLLLTGIRPGDLFEITAGDFDLKNKILRLNISKTARTIEFPIYKDLMKFINKNLSRIKTLSPTEKVFNLYSVDRIGKTFRKILDEIELKDESYNLKTFRKTFASSFADKGLSEGDLADLLGHSTTATTRAFYKSKNAGAIRGRMEALGK